MKSIKNTETRCPHLHIHTYRITHFFMVVLGSFSYGYASCPEVTVTTNLGPSSLQFQTVNLPPEFTDMRVECNLDANQFCATTLNVTDSTVVLDNTTAGEYINLNDYNFLRRNRSIFPTFNNELVITPTFVDINGNNFGAAVAIFGDGSILAVGSTNFVNLARVDIYQRQGTTWIAREVLTQPANNFGGFGVALSLSYDGSILAVTSASPTIIGISPAMFIGIFMYQFSITTNRYILTQTINDGALSGFANTVQLSATGQYLVVADDYNRMLGTEVNNAFNPSVRVYVRTETCPDSCAQKALWEPQADLHLTTTNGSLIPGSISSAIPCQYVTISGDGSTIAFSWPRVNSPNFPTIKGAVTIFKRTGSAWQQTQLLSQATTGFGTSVSLSSDGSYLAIGSGPEGLNNFVYIFALHGTQYVQQALFTIPKFGSSTKVSLSADGTVLAIGTGSPNISAASSGLVAIALRGPNNTWSLPFSLSVASSTSLGSGIACSADGAFIIAGEFGANSLQGAVRIYRPIGSFIPNDTVVTGSLCVYRRTTMNSTLRVAGNIHLNGTIVTGTAGQVTACTTALSDKRVKTNITTLTAEDAHAKLHALQPVGFDWNPAYKNPADRRVGFIAQHIEKIFPHWVGTMPALSEHAPLIDDGNIKMIAIKPELYAYLVAMLERLIKKNNERNEELAW